MKIAPIRSSILVLRRRRVIGSAAGGIAAIGAPGSPLSQASSTLRIGFGPVVAGLPLFVASFVATTPRSLHRFQREVRG